MKRGRKSKGEQTERTKLEEWLLKHTDEHGYKQFMDILNLGDKTVLETKMLETAKYQQSLETLKKSDEKLQEAKARVKECNEIHKEDKLATQKRLRLLGIVIAERFKDDILKPN